MKNISEEEILNACNKSESLAEAARKLQINYKTLRRLAKKFNCFSPNQSGKGIRKRRPRKIKTSDILDGKHPNTQSYKLKLRLFAEKIKQEICESCGLTEWRGRKISLELDHIDGNKYNNSLNNLKVLCPNCHSQTETYRAKNIGKYVLTPN